MSVSHSMSVQSPIFIERSLGFCHKKIDEAKDKNFGQRIVTRILTTAAAIGAVPVATISSIAFGAFRVVGLFLNKEWGGNGYHSSENALFSAYEIIDESNQLAAEYSKELLEKGKSFFSNKNNSVVSDNSKGQVDESLSTIARSSSEHFNDESVVAENKNSEQQELRSPSPVVPSAQDLLEEERVLYLRSLDDKSDGTQYEKFKNEWPAKGEEGTEQRVFRSLATSRDHLKHRAHKTEAEKARDEEHFNTFLIASEKYEIFPPKSGFLAGEERINKVFSYHKRSIAAAESLLAHPNRIESDLREKKAKEAFAKPGVCFTNNTISFDGHKDLQKRVASSLTRSDAAGKRLEAYKSTLANLDQVESAKRKNERDKIKPSLETLKEYEELAKKEFREYLSHIEKKEFGEYLSDIKNLPKNSSRSLSVGLTAEQLTEEANSKWNEHALNSLDVNAFQNAYINKEILKNKNKIIQDKNKKILDRFTETKCMDAQQIAEIKVAIKTRFGEGYELLSNDLEDIHVFTENVNNFMNKANVSDQNLFKVLHKEVESRLVNRKKITSEELSQIAINATLIKILEKKFSVKIEITSEELHEILNAIEDDHVIQGLIKRITEKFPEGTEISNEGFLEIINAMTNNKVSEQSENVTERADGVTNDDLINSLKQAIAEPSEIASEITNVDLLGTIKEIATQIIMETLKKVLEKFPMRKSVRDKELLAVVNVIKPQIDVLTMRKERMSAKTALENVLKKLLLLIK